MQKSSEKNLIKQIQRHASGPEAKGHAAIRLVVKPTIGMPTDDI